MPNIAKVLREEISRISRHEAKAAVTPIRKPAIRLRKDVANLKARLALLEKANKELRSAMSKFQAAQPAPSTEPEGKGWISGKGVRTLRKRLGLSQKEFGKLTGVTSHAVVLWEGKPGMLKFRDATKAAVFAARGIGKAEARRRLDGMAKKAASKPSRRGKAKRRGK